MVTKRQLLRMFLEVILWLLLRWVLISTFVNTTFVYLWHLKGEMGLFDWMVARIEKTFKHFFSILWNWYPYFDVIEFSHLVFNF